MITPNLERIRPHTAPQPTARVAIPFPSLYCDIGECGAALVDRILLLGRSVGRSTRQMCRCYKTLLRT